MNGRFFDGCIDAKSGVSWEISGLKTVVVVNDVKEGWEGPSNWVIDCLLRERRLFIGDITILSPVFAYKLIMAMIVSTVDDSDMSDLGEPGSCCDIRCFIGEQVEPVGQLAPSIKACPIDETADRDVEVGRGRGDAVLRMSEKGSWAADTNPKRRRKDAEERFAIVFKLSIINSGSDELIRSFDPGRSS